MAEKRLTWLWCQFRLASHIPISVSSDYWQCPTDISQTNDVALSSSSSLLASFLPFEWFIYWDDNLLPVTRPTTNDQRMNEGTNTNEERNERDKKHRSLGGGWGGGRSGKRGRCCDNSFLIQPFPATLFLIFVHSIQLIVHITFAHDLCHFPSPFIKRNDKMYYLLNLI